ncbi:hypothetical protein OAG68_01075 [bacterium]|nr:hypothetical protein [bacterium]
MVTRIQPVIRISNPFQVNDQYSNGENRYLSLEVTALGKMGKPERSRLERQVADLLQKVLSGIIVLEELPVLMSVFLRVRWKSEA